MLNVDEAARIIKDRAARKQKWECIIEHGEALKIK
jgi:hypothetical protein